MTDCESWKNEIAAMRMWKLIEVIMTMCSSNGVEGKESTRPLNFATGEQLGQLNFG
jgi:hypothetical protein